MKKSKLVTGFSLVAAIGLFTVLGVWKSHQPEQTPTTVIAGHDEETIIEEGIPSIGGPFELIDQNGNTRTEADFKGKPMLVYFGYTYCPDICPMGLTAVTQALKELPGIQPVFITVDPERDTVEQLKTYSQNFPDFVMLTGEREKINSAIKAYRVYAARASEERGANDYLMDHSSVIYFMDENGQFAKHFNHLSEPQEIIDGIHQWQHLHQG